MLIDTHAHVQFAKYKEDADQVMQRALSAGMMLVNVGSQIDTSRQAVAMLEKYPERVYAAVGLHPEHTWKHEHVDEDELDAHFMTRHEVFNYEEYKKLASHPKVVGIGECGLDYYRLPEVNREPGNVNHEDIKKHQKEAFLEQIKLAQELDKALIIHCRPSKGMVDAYEDVLEIISKIKNQNGKFRFEVHCFTGPWEIAQKFIELGGLLGLNGIITFDKTGVSEVVVKHAPLSSIVLETDSPYLAPVPYRGKRNEPVYIEEVAKKIAEVKGIRVEEVAEVTTNNAKKLFLL